MRERSREREKAMEERRIGRVIKEEELAKYIQGVSLTGYTGMIKTALDEYRYTG